MVDNISYHEPQDAGYFDLATTQINKAMVFETPTVDAEFLPNSKITVCYGKQVIKELVSGSGLTISGDSKTLTAYWNGPDYLGYEGGVLSVTCMFFIEGDVEVCFKLKIAKPKK